MGEMYRSSFPRHALPVALLTACPQGGQDLDTTSGSAAETDTSSAADPTPTTDQGSSSSSGGASTIDTSSSDPGTTLNVDTMNTTSVLTTDVTTTGTTAGTTGDESSDTGETGETGDIPDTTGGEVCEADAGEVEIPWLLEVPPALIGVDITAACSVVDVQMMGQEVALNLGCTVLGEVEPIALHYTLKPIQMPYWQPNTPVQLDYRLEAAPWTREWLRLDGEITDLWAVRADGLAPPGVTVMDYYQREISLLAPCDPLPDPCGQRQGLEVRVPYSIEDMDLDMALRSGEAAAVGFPSRTYGWLAHASRLVDPNGCDDAAPVAIDFMLIDDFNF